MNYVVCIFELNCVYTIDVSFCTTYLRDGFKYCFLYPSLINNCLIFMI